ncbi:hypothetical protein ACHHYP_13047 [Achlya hypogyna]|uniref:Uncharacterized protein n=1 Tax=Achlya hypogyna TaxID=1202772 RepID=A0A1V9ZG00_ACHHY|nr:hypothetical protein ACHHYP_13047 [Achlya hypogyna]
MLLGSMSGEETLATLPPMVPQTIKVNTVKEVDFMSVQLDESTKAWYTKAYRKDATFQKYATGKKDGSS